jgi:photosystem II stability/assembly factor-like uncharacterized protein
MLTRQPIFFLAPLLILALSTAAPSEAGVDRWTPTGPDTGYVTVLAAAPSRPSTVYASVSLGKMYRSTDRGNTWTLVGDLRQDVFVLHVDAGLPEVVYALGARSVYRSRDGGASWRPLLQNPDIFPVTLLTHPSVPGHVYVTLSDGRVLRSRTGGETWTQLHANLPAPFLLVADPSVRNVLYAVGGSPGVYKTFNSGASWSFYSRGLNPDARIEALAIDPSSPQTLYLVQESDSTQRSHLFKSRDGGVSWSPIPTDLGLGYARGLVVTGGRRPVLYLTLNYRAYRSTDDGRTWTELALPSPVWDVLDAPYGLLAGTSAGAFRSTDRGASWARSSRGLQGAWVSGLATHPTLPSLYVADQAGFLYTSPDSGQRWELLQLPTLGDLGTQLTGPVVLASSRPDTVYAGRINGILRSFDGGRRWSRSASLDCVRPTSLAVDPANDRTLYLASVDTATPCGSCFLFKSTDGGESWDCIEEGLPAGQGFLVAIDPRRPDAVYAVGGESLFRSENGGLSWSLVFDGLEATVLALSPAAPGVMFAGLADGVGRSADGGRTWSFDTEGLPEDIAVVALALDPADASTLYAATAGHGVFKSTDGGVTWTRLGQILRHSVVTTLVLDPRDRATLYAGTHGDGVWTLTQ